ncbi:hypothetical protein VTO42DRAFT_4100 [Malbranchea cinnamomea]
MMPLLLMIMNVRVALPQSKKKMRRKTAALDTVRMDRYHERKRSAGPATAPDRAARCCRTPARLALPAVHHADLVRDFNAHRLLHTSSFVVVVVAAAAVGVIICRDPLPGRELGAATKSGISRWARWNSSSDDEMGVEEDVLGRMRHLRRLVCRRDVGRQLRPVDHDADDLVRREPKGVRERAEQRAVLRQELGQRLAVAGAVAGALLERLDGGDGGVEGEFGRAVAIAAAAAAAAVVVDDGPQGQRRDGAGRQVEGFKETDGALSPSSWTERTGGVLIRVALGWEYVVEECDVVSR